MEATSPEARAGKAIEFRWLREVTLPLAGRDICLFVSHAPDGTIKPHVARYLEALRKNGVFSVLILAVEAPVTNTPDTYIADAIALRGNAGFDFGAWAAVLAQTPELWDASSLTFTNDSIFGPFNGFDDVIARMRASRADVIALTESYELKHHFQSYFMTFKGRALTSETMKRFWSGVTDFEDKTDVIKNYEIEIYSLCKEAGLSVEILFPLSLLISPSSGASRVLNPTHVLWRELIDAGFPFVKVQLLRDNPCRINLDGWKKTLRAAHADIPGIMRYLESAGVSGGYGVYRPDKIKIARMRWRHFRRRIRAQLGLSFKKRKTEPSCSTSSGE